ncbi:MAG: adenylyl-sulfate kinase [Gordonia sp. (in: high G+C Gram-positive bacteria)]|uniref:adenylyl-sulfate kinase n=1 Tax=Gordonia sp. (in: high G+C Gram-positive bacteria) TaxID=84139 RepID=UPI0039E6974E
MTAHDYADHGRQLLRLATAGSVDDGKSTLIGRLLVDTDSVPVDQLDQVTNNLGLPDLAALSDGLRAEREQGITIDVAYRFFSTPTRSYILADTPGHEHYTRNMFTGASNAHVAVLLVDARAGVLRQTRRHARIAQLLGVRHVVAAVNKIDLVDYDEARFREIDAEIARLGERLGIASPVVIPTAALAGDNIVHRSARTPWYDGPTLLEYLESVDLSAPDPDPQDLRLPVQWVSRPTEKARRRYTGRLSEGSLTVGDTVTVLPSGQRSTVTALDTLDDRRVTAVAPLSVSVELADELDISRGDVLVSGEAAAAPTLARELEATVCWFAGTPLRAGDRLALKHATSTTRATVQEISSKLDPDTTDRVAYPSELGLNDLGTVTIRTSSVVIADRYDQNRTGGSFILIDENSNETVGAGTISVARAITPGERVRTDVKWHPSSLARVHRWNSIGQRGVTVWLTGLPASGKSTLAVALERALVESGRAAYLLDGDNVRFGLSDDLGFSPGDRAENIRRVGHLTRLFADAGVVAIASLVSPLESDRAIARELNEAAGLAFIEIHVSTPVAECARRDPKGLYARARAGRLTGLTGWDAPYEVPANPDLVFDTTDADVERLVPQILTAIEEAQADTAPLTV